MNKKLIIIACSLLVGCGVALLAKIQNNKDRLFGLSIEALTEDETGLTGSCENTSNDCLWRCSSCKALYYADGNKGPSYNVHGICKNCGGNN